MVRSLSLCLCMLVLFVGCMPQSNNGGSNGAANANYEQLGFKIGILTGTVSQGEDEYRGAERVLARFGPDQVIHKTYPDNFMQEQETTVTQLMDMANDPEVKAIIVAQAVPGTLPAIKKARRQRKDLAFILVSPQEDPDQVSQYADLILQTDDLRRGTTLVTAAAEMGAKTFVHYTFPRHMSMEILSQRRNVMRDLCEEKGMKWVDANAPDPMADQGIAGSQKFILEDVPRMIAEHGKNTAFFSTNCAMQEPLIRAALDGGAIFPSQCCPSPTHGYPGALGITIAEEEAGDMNAIREQIQSKVHERGGQGRFGTWMDSMHMVMIEAGVDLAKAKVEEDKSLASIPLVKEKIEGRSEMIVSIETYREYPNFLMVIANNVPF